MGKVKGMAEQRRDGCVGGLDHWNWSGQMMFEMFLMDQMLSVVHCPSRVHLARFHSIPSELAHKNEDSDSGLA